MDFLKFNQLYLDSMNTNDLDKLPVHSVYTSIYAHGKLSEVEKSIFLFDVSY
jgi:hypothetical protein